MTNNIRIASLMFIVLNCFFLARAQAAEPTHRPPSIKVVLVGDSTVAAEGGWGPGFCAHLIQSADCVDLAANGRSSKSFIREGRWDKALQERGQFYFIQFGDNDQKDIAWLYAGPQTAFKANLKRFIADVRRIGGSPILVTPLSRRDYQDGRLLEVTGRWKIIHPLSDYAAVDKQVAREEGVPLIDLYKSSRAFLKTMTQEQADRFDATSHPDAKAEGASNITPDRTHLNDLGKKTFGTMVARLAARSVPDLRPYITLKISTRQMIGGVPVKVY